MNSVHPSEVTAGISFPKHVANQLVGAAIRKIPGAGGLLNKIQKPQGVKMNVLNGLVPHEYHSNGTLQFSFG